VKFFSVIQYSTTSEFIGRGNRLQYKRKTIRKMVQKLIKLLPLKSINCSAAQPFNTVNVVLLFGVHIFRISHSSPRNS